MTTPERAEIKRGKHDRIRQLLKIIKPQRAEKALRFMEQLEETRCKNRRVTVGEVLNLNRKRG
jgi:hypothetical protein